MPPTPSRTERVKRLVDRVLSGNAITAHGDSRDSLIGGDALSESDREELLWFCRQRLDAFGRQHGATSVNPAPTGPGGAPHRAQEPRRHRRLQQPAGPRLPLQCRQARRLFADARGRIDFRCLQASYALREAGCVFFWLEAAARC